MTDGSTDVSRLIPRSRIASVSTGSPPASI
jgi:hypothetical protein